MGLDITACERIVMVPEDDESIGTSYVWDGGFVGRLDPFTKGRYRMEGETHRFRAGSYSTYSVWRNGLARLASVSPWSGETDDDGAPVGPFRELIRFTDCDGSIGPRVAEKLARDFDNNEDAAVRFDEANDLDGWWIRIYRDFQRAFRLAARGGVVIFH